MSDVAILVKSPVAALMTPNVVSLDRAAAREVQYEDFIKFCFVWDHPFNISHVRKGKFDFISFFRHAHLSRRTIDGPNSRDEGGITTTGQFTCLLYCYIIGLAWALEATEGQT